VDDDGEGIFGMGCWCFILVLIAMSVWTLSVATGRLR
jgi:hypothetical protein